MANTVNYQVVVDVVTKEGYDKWKKNINDVNRSSKATKQTTSELRNNLLSAMFAGMAMAKLFMGQIERIGELTGAGEMIKAFYTMALIEPMMKITELLSNLLTKFNELEPATKKMIGWSMILLTLVGTMIAFGAAVGLATFGLKGLIPLFSGLGSVIAGIGLGSLLLGLLVIIVVIGALYIAWKNNLGGIRDTTKAVATDIYDIFAGLFTLDLPRLMHGFGSLFIDSFVGITIAVLKFANAILHAVGYILALLPGISKDDISDSFRKIDTLLSDVQKSTFANVDKWLGGNTTKTPASFSNMSLSNLESYGINNIPKMNINVTYGSDISNLIGQVTQ